MRSSKKPVWFLALAVISAQAISAQSVFADTVSLEPSKDNTLFEDSDGTLSNGAGERLLCGRTGEPNNRRALIAFDFSSLPAGSVISSVSLTLNASKVASSSAQSTSLHRLLADWGEGSSNASGQEGRGADAATGDATWIHRFNATDLWDSPGGDFNPAASASLSVGATGSYTWPSNASLIADVQRWVDDPETNFGWILIGNEGSSRTAKRFDSRENSSLVRPQLTVEFAAAPDNAAPVVAVSIGDESLSAGGSNFTVDLAAGAIFSDEGDELTFGAVSDDESAVTVTIEGGNVLEVTAVSSGAAMVTVTATDSQSQGVSLSFAVTVTAIAGDFDESGRVDLDDFFEFADAFGRTTASDNWDATFDLIINGEIDLDDFFEFADNFGQAAN